MVLKIPVNSRNFKISKVARYGICSKKSRLMYMLHWESLSMLRRRNESTSLKMDVPVLYRKDFQSWIITVPPTRRSWSYTFLSSRKGTSLLAELINCFWIAPNLSHHSNQAASNPSQVTTEMWNSERSLLVEPRRQKEKNNRLCFASVRVDMSL